MIAPVGNAAATWPGRRRTSRRCSSKANRAGTADSDDPFASHVRSRKTTLRSGQGAAHRRDSGHRHGQFPHAQGRRPFPRPAGRRRETDLSHRRRAAQGRQRQLHHRRFLRKPHGGVRRHVRLRADPQAARVAGHDRPDLGRRHDQQHRHQAQAGRERRRGPRQAPRRRLPRNSTSTPGATSKGRCWPRCRWKPPSSTSSCS